MRLYQAALGYSFADAQETHQGVRQARAQGRLVISASHSMRSCGKNQANVRLAISYGELCKLLRSLQDYSRRMLSGMFQMERSLSHSSSMNTLMVRAICIALYVNLMKTAWPQAKIGSQIIR